MTIATNNTAELAAYDYSLQLFLEITMHLALLEITLKTHVYIFRGANMFMYCFGLQFLLQLFLEITMHLALAC